MDCPQCGTAMRERDRAGVKIDFCPNCKGVWLDRGELDKIIAIELEDDVSAPVVDARSRPGRRDDDDDDDDDDDRGLRPARRRYEEGKPKSKKGSFFESLTDMFGGE